MDSSIFAVNYTKFLSGILSNALRASSSSAQAISPQKQCHPGDHTSHSHFIKHLASTLPAAAREVHRRVLKVQVIVQPNFDSPSIIITKHRQRTEEGSEGELRRPGVVGEEHAAVMLNW